MSTKRKPNTASPTTLNQRVAERAHRATVAQLRGFVKAEIERLGNALPPESTFTGSAEADAVRGGEAQSAIWFTRGSIHALSRVWGLLMTPQERAEAERVRAEMFGAGDMEEGEDG